MNLTSRWKNVLDENEDGFLRTELDPLADNINKLTNSQISWDQVPEIFAT